MADFTSSSNDFEESQKGATTAPEITVNEGQQDPAWLPEESPAEP